MKIFLPLSVALLLSLNSLCQTDNSSVFISIMKTEFEAFQKKNPALWMNHIDSNAVFVNADNTYKSRDQIAEEMKNASGIFSYATETYENIVTRVFGDAGILSCISTFSFKDSEGNLNRINFHFTRVHIKKGTEWKLVYHSAIPI